MTAKSTKKKPTMNGKVDILASAMRDVFGELMDTTREGIKEDVNVVVDELGRLEGRLNDRLDGVEKSVGKLDGKTDYLTRRINETNKKPKTTKKETTRQAAST